MSRAPRPLAFRLWLALATLATAGAAGANGPPGPEPIDPAAKLQPGGSASEYWDVVALLDDGFRVTARVTITNEGPGEQSAAAFGHVLRPDAEPVAFQNGRRKAAWRLSPDRRRIEIGSSLLDLAAGARHFEVDNEKRGVKVFLDWQSDRSARSAPARLLPDGYRIDLLQLATPARASIQVAGMPAPRSLRGTLSLTHTWMREPEGELVLRRVDVASVGRAADGGAFLVALQDPEGERFSWLSVQHPKAPASERNDVRVEIESEVPAGGYPIPTRLALSAPGLHGEVSSGPAWLEVDPLAALPGFLRMVYSLRGRPHRSWTNARVELSWVPGPELPTVRIAGDAIAALTFLDALPQSQTLP